VTCHEDTGCTVDGEYVAYDMIDSTSDCSPEFLSALLISQALEDVTYLLDFHGGQGSRDLTFHCS
jgi:hypothetical protein